MYWGETLKVAGLKQPEKLDGEEDYEDETENFQKEEKTQKNENLEYFARLMR